MTRWRQIESLFEEALTRAPSERDAFLLETCAADIELLAEVLSLLSNDDGGSSEWTWAAEAAAQLIAQRHPRQIPGHSRGRQWGHTRLVA